jgi:hypothetical protein
MLAHALAAPAARESYSDGHVAVFDDVLPQDTFDQLWLFMNLIAYQSTAAGIWAKVWNTGDGNIFRARDHTTDHLGMPRSETVVDALVDRVIALARRQPALEGLSGLTLIPYVWPAGTSISWHSDGASADASDRIGGFTYYVHKQWNAEWGGEFLLFPERGRQALPFDNSELSKQIVSTGIGTWFAPRPNRLLFVVGDVLHKVAKTTPAAAPRLTIQGFIHRRR